ncbi:MAG TPA: TIR domain-containing protein, partial [Caulobacteraceae bacterium]
MSGVFLSYSRADRALADAIIRGLRAVGVVVWWDEDMRSIDWHQELERQIVELASIVVLWTPSSSTSDHVKDEARLGLESNKLINVIVGLPKPPFPYDRVNGLPLDGWTEREPNRGWTRLIETIEEKVVEKGGATPGELTGALARREESLRLKQQALARAQEALEEAQAREAETIDAAQVAQATFTRAEEQHLRVMEMRATHLIMSAAAQEYEAARAAKEDADRAQRAAKTEVKGVAREVALAIAALESPDSATAARRPKSATPPITGKPPEAEVEAAPPAAPPVATVEPSKTAAKPAVKSEPAPAAAATPAPAPAAPATALAGAAAPVAAAAAPVVAASTAPTATAKPAVAQATAAPAAAATAAPSFAAPAPAAGSSRIVIFAVVGVLVLALIGGGVWFMMNQHKNPPAPVAGKWSPPGLGCDAPVVIAVINGAISMTVAGSTSTST